MTISRRAAAIALAALLLGGCSSTSRTDGGTTITPTAESDAAITSKVFDPRTDSIDVSRDDLVFPVAAGEQLFDRIVAAAGASTAGWRHLPRVYRGGNYLTETWCSEQVSADDCETTRAPQAAGARTILHSAYSYRRAAPFTVEGNDLTVVRNADQADGWSVRASLHSRRASSANSPIENFSATVVHAAAFDGVSADTSRSETITVTDTPEYQLDGAPGSARVTDGMVRLPPSSDALQQLSLFTGSASAMTARLGARLDTLQAEIEKVLDGEKFGICEQKTSLRGAAGVAVPGRLGMPAPECVPRPVTDADVAALRAAADSWFAAQHRLLTDHGPEIYRTLMASFPWKSLE